MRMTLNSDRPPANATVCVLGLHPAHVMLGQTLGLIHTTLYRFNYILDPYIPSTSPTPCTPIHS